MNEPLGDKLFWITIVAFGLVFIIGWVILIAITILQWLLPDSEVKLESFLQKISKPLGFIQKYSIYAAAILFLLRLLAGWLGWATPLNSNLE